LSDGNERRACPESNFPVWPVLMKWESICDIESLQTIIANSEVKPQLFYKHSSRCFISTIVRSKFDDANDPELMDYLHIDVLSCRSLSSIIAEHFSITHQSPQAILIYKGECILDESHQSIDPSEFIEIAHEVTKGSEWRIAR
jgi:bacillithiol system protein YtxJ